MDEITANLRQNCSPELNEANAASDPFKQFRLWFEQALEADLYEPTAMTLATVSAEGVPSARMVLLKDMDRRGFVFYTNYQSKKGQELDRTPWATLVLWWDKLKRQVRIEGSVEKIAAEESDEYFKSRPRNYQLAAWASPQSQVISGRNVLENKLQEWMKQFEDKEVPRPPFWGGYRVNPTQIEFWQGRPNRLHDRLRYRKSKNGRWLLERLSP